MNLLAVETATHACSAALSLNGEITERFEISPREHTRLILPMIDALMSEAAISLSQLDALAFGCGPGAFTGVRIATAIVHGIAIAGDLPIVPVSTLANLASQGFKILNSNHVFTAIDARMGQVYWAEYFNAGNGVPKLLDAEIVTNVSDIVLSGNKGVAVGSGWDAFAEPLQEKTGDLCLQVDSTILPRAYEVAESAEKLYKSGFFQTVEEAWPVYLRDNVAKKQMEQ